MSPGNDQTQLYARRSDEDQTTTQKVAAASLAALLLASQPQTASAKNELAVASQVRLHASIQYIAHAHMREAINAERTMRLCRMIYSRSSCRRTEARVSMSSHTMGARIALCPPSLVLLKPILYLQSLYRRKDN